MGPGIIFEVSRLHSDTQYSVELLWMSDRPFAETSTWKHTTYTRDRRPSLPAEFEPAIPGSKRQPDLHLDRAATEPSIYIFNHSNKVMVNLVLCLFK